MKENNIHAENHSLFKESRVTTNYVVYVKSFNEKENKINDLWFELSKAQRNDTLELRISSPGGLVTECQQFVNIIKNKFKDRTTAIIESHASSAGAIVFCAADKRIVYENSRIMLHNYSGSLYGTHHKMKTRMDFDTKHVIGFLKSVIMNKKNKFLSKEEFKEFVRGHEFWFETPEMCRRGIATHVIIDGRTITAKEYLKKYSKGK